MAADFIQLNLNVSTATEAQNLLSAISQFRAGCQAIQSMREKMVHCKDGSDYTMLEAVFGIPTGKGDPVFYMVDATKQQLDNGSVQNLISSIG